jgi:hypothetical protein
MMRRLYGAYLIFMIILAQHFVWTLVRKYGNLDQLFDDVARTQDIAVLIELLRKRRFPDDAVSKALLSAPYPPDRTVRRSRLALPFGDFGELDKDLQLVAAVFGRALTTFIVGHEMGHVYLGHIGSHPRKPVLTDSGRLPFSDLLALEIEADHFGLISVWDGLANATEGGSSASIDYTWVVPVFFLSTMFASSMYAFPKTTYEEENAEKWLYRLTFLLNLGLCRPLRRLGFESARAQRVISTAPTVAAATVEWIRLELSNAPTSEKPDYDLFHALRDLLERFS